MKVMVTKEFAWAPDGNHVRYVKPREVLDGRGAQVAIEMQCGEALTEAAGAAAEPQGGTPLDGGASNPAPSPPPHAPAAEAPVGSEQKAGATGFSTADIGRKKRHGR
jgi:hypothetical protein